jgi:membrane-bound lytic murein transglycosylase D
MDRLRSPKSLLIVAGLGGAALVTGLTGTFASNTMGTGQHVSTASAVSAPELPPTRFLDKVLRIEPQEPVAEVAEVYWDLPNLDHPRVDYWVERFTTDKRDEFTGFLQRKGQYEAMILEKLDERGMPRDLLYLAMIESGFRPNAYSSAAASGLWQFIAETGQRYGLDINRAVDERRDPERSTEAALSYLTDLHKRFDSWYLASAAYNTGENRVGRIMRRETGSERGREEDYYRIWEHLPRETRDYVPLMVAAARISKEPAKYGFDHVEKLAPPAVELLRVNPATPLAEIARQKGTSVDELRRLNPQLKLNRTRNDMPSYVRVPSSG